MKLLSSSFSPWFHHDQQQNSSSDISLHVGGLKCCETCSNIIQWTFLTWWNVVRKCLTIPCEETVQTYCKHYHCWWIELELWINIFLIQYFFNRIPRCFNIISWFIKLKLRGRICIVLCWITQIVVFLEMIFWDQKRTKVYSVRFSWDQC